MPQADMDNVPLFEREHRRDGQLVQRLQSELADAKRFVEAQARRQNDLEYVNEDLERRCGPYVCRDIISSSSWLLILWLCVCV